MLLNVSEYLVQEHATNDVVRRKVKAAMIGEYDKLLTLVKERKLGWFGLISMFFGLVKTNLKGQ